MTSRHRAMSIARRSLLGLALFAVAGSAGAAPGASADCAVLDLALREARTDFRALKRKAFGAARCFYSSREYKCVWAISTDRYGDAEGQVERLNRCTAAQPGAARLQAKRGETAFQLNPETAVFIRGPDGDAGYWKIQLKITTTEDWD